MMPPRLLVIGGSGFIGQHVVKRGLSQGWQVTSLGMSIPKITKTVHGANYIVGDFTQVNSLLQIANNQFDYVVNLGGYIDHTLFCNGGRRLIYSHFDGLLNLLEFLDRKCIKRFIQIGSSDEYGDAIAPQREDLRECPISPYSLAKVASTHFLQMMWRTEKFPAVILRLFLTYGPGQDIKRFLPQIIKGFLRDMDVPVSKGEQLRDFCYVEDVVCAIFLALHLDSVEGEIFNVGSGIPVSIKTMIEQVCSIVGKGRPKFGVIQYRSGENMALFADTKKIFDRTGWMPKVSMELGLSKTIESMRGEHA